MKYTKPMTFNELSNEIQKIAQQHKMKVYVYKAKRNDGDDKISTEITVKSDKCEIKFYDYKMTNLYSSSMPSPTAFRKAKYEWHVKFDDSLMLLVFASILEE